MSNKLQASSIALTSLEKATDLWLAIVKRCVEAYKGQITVNSKVGVKTTFTVILALPETAN